MPLFVLGSLVNTKLSIFEAPHFFEALLHDHRPDDAIDIIARIYGICPITYQVSTSLTFEHAFGVTPKPNLITLRRLLYYGEWIESHALHVFILHAPNFLDYDGAIEMTADHHEIVERNLQMKKTSNHLIEMLNKHTTHPISPRIDGFHKAPTIQALSTLHDNLTHRLDEAVETMRWTASLDTPNYTQNYVFMSMIDNDHYPIEDSDTITMSERDNMPITK